MNRRPCTCRHCATPAPAAVEEKPEPVRLPDLPTPIRVHHDGRTQDCTLHPDGTLTAVLGGELRRNMLTFAEMRERNWAGAHVEFNPPPLTDEPPEGPAPAVVQAAIPLTA